MWFRIRNNKCLKHDVVSVVPSVLVAAAASCATSKLVVLKLEARLIYHHPSFYISLFIFIHA